MNPTPRYVNERAAAEMLGVSLSTLRKWRCARRGPAYSKMGEGRNAPVRYSVQALLDYAESVTVSPL